MWKTNVPKVSDSDPQELFKVAEESFEKKQYSKAAQLYQRLKSGHPDFEKMPQIYIRLGDSFFHDKNYEEAVSRYRQFTELYPNNKDRFRAKYMIGMSFFNQIKGVDLDNTMVRKAEEAFKEVTSDSEAGEWATKAEEKYRECRKKLAEKEIYKARTYVSTKNYKAAKMAAQRVLDEYSNLGMDKEANKLIEALKGK